jgi:hypothetical protein
MTRNSLRRCSFLRMINRAQECRQRAQHCERARSLAITLEARLMYFDLAQQWRELADQVEQLERTSGEARSRPTTLTLEQDAAFS